MRTSLVAILLLSGCIRDVGRGPDLGECANYPEGSYTYGEIGIGHCLAGPADLAFFEKDGTPWLAVSNADPYRNFDSGNVLLVDWSTVDTTTGRNLIHELRTGAVATDQFVGGLGVIEDRDLLMVSGRYSANSVNRSDRDDLWVLDISDPEAPSYWSEGERLQLRDDPFPIEVDDAQDRAWVVNLTDHSVSVLDTSTTPLTKVDVAGVPDLTEGPFVDGDGSGSVAEVGSLGTIDADQLLGDLWTLTYIDGTYRIWLPEDGGLQRYSSPDTLDWIESPFLLELDPETVSVVDQIDDPTVTGLDGNLFAFFTDSDGIAAALATGPGATAWSYFEDPAVVGEDWDAQVASPSVTLVAGGYGLFYDGREAESDGASIGLAVSEDIEIWERQGPPVLDVEDTPWLSLEDPFVLSDPLTGTLRMWLTVWDGSSWQIAVSESGDGFSWSVPRVVLDSTDGDVGAPTVTWMNGRYVMFFGHRAEAGWTHAVAWSWDGETWHESTDVLSADEPTADTPPRLALQADATGQWRIKGQDAGTLSTYGATGGELLAFDHGYSLTIAAGHEIAGLELPDDAGENGLKPGSFLDAGGQSILYVTALGDDDRETLHALAQDVDGQWTVLASDLVPEGTGGNEVGASHPVVYERDGAYAMVYAGRQDDGTTSLHVATSTDGLDFEPVSGAVLETESDFDDLVQEPHSIEVLQDGTYRLWYAGSDGARFQIGSALSEDGLEFAAEPSENEQFQFTTGIPGAFDDSGVKDPYAIREGDTTHLWYAGFDGSNWHLGYASRVDGGDWKRRDHPFTDEPLPSLSGNELLFDTGGAESPVVHPDGEDGYVAWYAGFDNFRHRIGVATGAETLFPNYRYPTAGDQLSFETRRGDYFDTVIELAQSVDAFNTDGIGASGLTYDEERGFLYVPSKLSASLYVIDVRDDSDGDFVDRNYNDVEALVRIRTLSGTGMRDVVVDETRDRLYVATRFPDGLVALDRSQIVDDDIKQIHEGTVLGALPLRNLQVDEGGTTLGGISGAGLALAPDGDTLVATHFRSNGVAVFDLSRGLVGEEIAWLPYIGENPYDVEISPDGRYAVVANYVGELDEDQLAESTLAVIDLETLEAVTWLANR